MSSTQTATKQARLLGLPRELRLQIYQYVFALDLDCTIVKRWRHDYVKNCGFRGNPIRDYDAKLVLPWFQLSLVCREPRAEIKSYMSGRGFLDDDQNIAYSLHLKALDIRTRLEPVTWKCLPCPPQAVRFLDVTFDASSSIKEWRDGDSTDITGGLYQTLNFLLHYGPKLDSNCQLQHIMHFQEIGIIVGENDVMPADWRTRLRKLVNMITNNNVLCGPVDKISIWSGDTSLSMEPGDIKRERSIPRQWNV